MLRRSPSAIRRIIRQKCRSLIDIIDKLSYLKYFFYHLLSRCSRRGNEIFLPFEWQAPSELRWLEWSLLLARASDKVIGEKEPSIAQPALLLSPKAYRTRCRAIQVIGKMDSFPKPFRHWPRYEIFLLDIVSCAAPLHLLETDFDQLNHRCFWLLRATESLSRENSASGSARRKFFTIFSPLRLRFFTQFSIRGPRLASYRLNFRNQIERFAP